MQDPMSERGTTAGDVAKRVEMLQGFRRLDEAAEECGNGLASFPEDPRLWELLAEIEQARKRLGAAEHAARTAIRLDPEDGFLPATLIQILLDQERFAEARDLARGLVERFSWNAGAHLLLARAEAGVAQQQPGAVHLARQHAQTAVSLAPSDPGVLSAAAAVMGDIKDRAEAARLVRAGLAIDPGDSVLLLQQAAFGARTDIGATRLIRSALAADPTDSAAAWAFRETIWVRRRWIPAFAIWSAAAIAVPPAVLFLVVLTIQNLVILLGSMRAIPRGELRRTWERAPRLRFAVPLALVCLPWPLWGVATHGFAIGVPLFGLMVAELAILFGSRADERRLEGLHSGSTLRMIARTKQQEANTGWGRLGVGVFAALFGVVLTLSAGGGILGRAGEWRIDSVIGACAAFGIMAVFAGPPLVVLAQAKERRLVADRLPADGAARTARRIAAAAIGVAAIGAIVGGVGLGLSLS